MITAEKGISNEILTQNLDLVLRVLPDNAFQRQQPSPLEDLAVPIGQTSVRSSSGQENYSNQTDDENMITAASLSDVGEETGASRDEVISMNMICVFRKADDSLNVIPSVYHLFLESHQLCRDSMWTPDLLS